MKSAAALLLCAGAAMAQRANLTSPTGGVFIPTNEIIPEIQWHSYPENFAYESAYFTLASTASLGSSAHGSNSDVFLGTGNFTASETTPDSGFIGAARFYNIYVPSDTGYGPYNLTAQVFGYVGAEYEPLQFSLSVPVCIAASGDTGCDGQPRRMQRTRRSIKFERE